MAQFVWIIGDENHSRAKNANGPCCIHSQKYYIPVEAAHRTGEAFADYKIVRRQGIGHEIMDNAISHRHKGDSEEESIFLNAFRVIGMSNQIRQTHAREKNQAEGKSIWEAGITHG